MSYFEAFSRALLWSACFLNLWWAYRGRMAFKELDRAGKQMDEMLRLLQANPNATVTIVTPDEAMKKKFEDQLRGLK